MKKRLMLGSLFVIGLLLVPKTGYAHLVELLSSMPENGSIVAESPPLITAVFSEEVQTETSSMRVYNAQGEVLDNGDGGVDLNDPDHASMKVSVSPLEVGAYTVRWRVVLLDGDATAGEFSFFVGDQAAADAANYTPSAIEPGATTTAVPTQNPSNTIWLTAGIAFSALVIGGAVFIFLKKV